MDLKDDEGEPRNTYLNFFVTHLQASYMNMRGIKLKGGFYIQYDQILILLRAIETIHQKCT